MPAPVYSDLAQYPGTFPTWAGGTPYGGAIVTSSPINAFTINVDLPPVALNPTDTTTYGILYIQNNCVSPGSLQTARVYNRSGAQLNSSSGTAQYVSNLSTDTGLVVTTGKVGGVFVQDTVTLTGVTPVYGVQNWDANWCIRHEYLNLSSSPSIPTGNITISVSSQIIAVIYGTYSNPVGQSLGCYWASAEFQFALATAKNTMIIGQDSSTAPTTTPFTYSMTSYASGAISAFSSGTYWAGSDQSLPVPSSFLDSGEYVGLCFSFTAYANCPITVSNQVDHFPIMLGVPSSSL